MANETTRSAPAGNQSDAHGASTGDDGTELSKTLKNRHIQLIALGGAIGTGLFYGSSESIQRRDREYSSPISSAGR